YNNNGTNIQTLAGTATGHIYVQDGTHTLTVGTVDGASGIVSSTDYVWLVADAIVLQQPVSSAVNSEVLLSPYTQTQQITLGGGNSAGVLGVTDAELG